MDDRELKQVVLEELDFEPSIAATDLGIAVDGGVVTITGHVPSMAAKSTVTDIVESVRGVRVIVDRIEVRPVGAHITADDEIAKRLVNSLTWSTSIPEDRIHVTIVRGWVTLKGTVDWQFQAHAAEQLARSLSGVRGVKNQLKIVRTATAEDIAAGIRAAFRRNAVLAAKDLRISVEDGKVTLEGEVHYLSERRSAERAAWAAPGVTEVIDRLVVV